MGGVMSEAVQGLLVLGGTSLGTSVLFHYLDRSYIRACVLSAVVSSVLFQIFAYFHAGYLDPFFIIALIVGAAAAFVISLIVGLPFKK